jgi:hypothetical protein
MLSVESLPNSCGRKVVAHKENMENTIRKETCKSFCYCINGRESNMISLLNTPSAYKMWCSDGGEEVEDFFWLVTPCGFVDTRIYQRLGRITFYKRYVGIYLQVHAVLQPIR